MIEQVQSKIAATLARAQNFLRAWRCQDKILVIESDDWGSIRTSSAEAYKFLTDRKYPMNQSCWSIDALETDEDLESLFEVLERFKDRRDCPACITGNMVMANPNFSIIREQGYKNYTYEPVQYTLSSSPGRKRVVHLWQEGMKNRCFRPQFHAREHVRWWEWMAALQQNSLEALETFNLHMCGVPFIVSKERQSFFLPPYIDSSIIHYLNVNLHDMVGEGIKLFEEQFGFRSLSTIAPNCAWTNEIEQVWAEHGVRYIQGGYCQHFLTHQEERLIPHYLGQQSQNNSWYLVRNCTFEPAKNAHNNSWRNCLTQIERAFRFNTPAIVSSHRVNYIGSIDESNRTRGLNQLKRLIEEVTSRWPEVYFLSSPELGYMIEHGINRVSDLTYLENKIFPEVRGKSESIQNVMEL